MYNHSYCSELGNSNRFAPDKIVKNISKHETKAQDNPLAYVDILDKDGEAVVTIVHVHLHELHRHHWLGAIPPKHIQTGGWPGHAHHLDQLQQADQLLAL